MDKENGEEFSVKHYRKYQVLGKGNFGAVFLGRHKIHGTTHAVKEIELDLKCKRRKDLPLREVLIMSAVHHPNIVDFEGAAYLEGGVYIVMEYCAGGNLRTKLEKEVAGGTLWSDDKVMRYFVHICLAVKHLHDNAVIHRDLKTENVFLTANHQVKLGDFGLARFLKTGDKCTTVTGSPRYLAPEVVQGMDYDFKADVWSLGVSLFELLSGGDMPFDQPTRNELFEQICFQNRSSLPSSSPVLKIVDQLLEKDQRHRPTMNEIIALPLCQEAFHKSVTCSDLAGNLKPQIDVGDGKFVNFSYDAKVSKRNMGLRHVSTISTRMNAPAAKDTGQQPLRRIGAEQSSNTVSSVKSVKSVKSQGGPVAYPQPQQYGYPVSHQGYYGQQPQSAQRYGQYYGRQPAYGAARLR